MAKVKQWMRDAAKSILHAGSWPDEWEPEDVSEIAQIIADAEPATGPCPKCQHIHSGQIICGHAVELRGPKAINAELEVKHGDNWKLSDAEKLIAQDGICQCPSATGPTPDSRKIDGKFSMKYGTSGGKIVNTVSGEEIPEDEPLFLLRGRDHNALTAINAYQDACEKDGCNDLHLAGAQQVREEFCQFAAEHPERMKQPGITRHLKLGAASKSGATPPDSDYRLCARFGQRLSPEEFIKAAFPDADLDKLEINARLVIKWLGEALNA